MAGVRTALNRLNSQPLYSQATEMTFIPDFYLPDSNFKVERKAR